MSKALGELHFQAMEEVEDGAVIFDYAIARLLQDVQREEPQCIDIISTKELEQICPTGSLIDRHGRPAYFGAMLTDKGKHLLKIRNR